MVMFYQTCIPETRFRSWIAPDPDGLSFPVTTDGVFFDHVVINQTRYTSLLRANASADALITVQTNEAGATWVGELLEIFSLVQPPLGTQHYGYVRWLMPFDGDIVQTAWRERCYNLIPLRDRRTK